MSKKRVSDSTVIPIRVPKDMGRRIKELARKTGQSEATIMRLAIAKGFAEAERVFSEPEGVAA